MTVKKLGGKQLSQMFIFGAENLNKNVKMVDALNVFPVPDGDTGTNMNLTITSGVKEVKGLDTDDANQVASLFSKGLLMGARGNSGVILSQLFRGFSKAIAGKSSIDTKLFAEALESGVETAYKAVMKPVEGTILTVAKDSAKKATKAARKSDDLIDVMEQTLLEAKASLDRTPDLLPVLKEVGVVDSGGQGLVTIYEGFLAVLEGKELPEESISGPSMNELVNAEHHKAQMHMKTEDIHYGYCTEFMVKFKEEKTRNAPFSEEDFRNKLNEHGDSLLVVSDEELVKVHIHTEEPGDMLTLAQTYGDLINIKIENMREQHSAILESDHQPAEKVKVQAKKKPFGIITVSMGTGIEELFKSLGATVVIAGGQTMNPSTEDIVKAIEEAHAEKLIVLPNNGNIVMAAEQAASVVDEDVAVVKTKTVPQGISALLAFNPSSSLEDNQTTMSEAAGHVKSGQITFAVRDTSIDGVEINKDDFMGIFDGKIVTSKKTQKEAVESLLNEMMSDDDEIVTIIYGEDANEEEANELEAWIGEAYPDAEVEIHPGKQPIYSYIISVE
ncbi:DAK2 domain-containing protein [Pseudalkalibacillus berkeleyi]|uniref:DAK2 domain-containing protein n=1 Tax=Pseudalkalibacillus berkeleyi TaxID=1069813 RepID=A0ABS9GZ73_9BACL|nr:DAK2 domain-containing protein [Pseudalkalibacillus berkeleyi]MCF6137066.1 DAK2 domain-containing protein [Pseudalkalibacillus berkeleyi]